MISLYEILEASNGQLFGEPAAQIFSDFCVDADKPAQNSLFVTLRNDHGDSHIYIKEAIEKGASGVLCTRPPECDTQGVSVVIVRNTVEALLAWSQYVLHKTGVTVIGVAGSSGKSLTVDAIGRVLGARYPVHAEMRESDGRLSIPLALANFNASHKFVVLKLGTTQQGEMARVIQSVNPTVGVVTHISEYSDSYFASSEQLAQENKALVDSLPDGALAVLNYDDDLVRNMANGLKANVKTIGLDSFGADMMAFNVQVALEGTQFDLRQADNRNVGEWIPLLGKHNLYAVLAALTVGLHYDVPLDAGLNALKELSPLAGRMNPLIGINDSLVVDDTNNADIQSTMSSLAWLSEVKEDKGRTFFVLGDIGTSSSRSRLGYRHIGQGVSDVADVFIAQGMEVAQAARASLDQGMQPQNIHITYSAQDSIALIKQYDLTADDIVLLKGGIHARIEQVTEALLKDDTDSVKLPRRQLMSHASTQFQSTRPSWVEVDLNAVANNVTRLKKMVGQDVAIMAIVKSDAYGHGAVAVSRTALMNGAEYLGVSSIQEAFELRDAGILAPILVMSYTPTYLVRQAIQQNITLTLYDLELARAYERIAREVNDKLTVHIKVDSGMGRLGILTEETVSLFRHLTALQNLVIEGIYTHFSMADEDSDYTAEQTKAFKSVVRPLEATTGQRFKFVHACNSAGTIAHQDSHFNMVRPGLALYGLHPSGHVKLPDGFQPALSWKTNVAQVKTLPLGHSVGYGNTYTTKGEETVAVIPVGYTDGLRRGPIAWTDVLVHGIRAPIIGRVSMEKTVINVSHIQGVSIGDEVVLIGQQGGQNISVEDAAQYIGTNNYEVVTSILPRVPRK